MADYSGGGLRPESGCIAHEGNFVDTEATKYRYSSLYVSWRN